MDDINDFAGMEALKNIVSSPPEKIIPVKPSKDDMSLHLFGKTLAKPLPKRYSYSKVDKIFQTIYGCTIKDVTGYKGTRGDNPRKIYTVFDADGKPKVEEVTLFQLGQWLEEQGDYKSKREEILDDADTSRRYMADVYYYTWYKKNGKTRPNSKYMRDVFVEESDRYFMFYDIDGNYLLKKKKDSVGTMVIPKDKFYSDIDYEERCSYNGKFAKK